MMTTIRGGIVVEIHVPCGHLLGSDRAIGAACPIPCREELALIETATDVKPIVIGKPEPVLYEMSLKRMKAVPEQTLVLGDRLETDILGAVRLNLKSAMVLSGVTQREELTHSDYQPDWVFDDISDVVKNWAMIKLQ